MTIEANIGIGDGLGNKYQLILGKPSDRKGRETSGNAKYFYCKNKHQGVCHFKDKNKSGNNNIKWSKNQKQYIISFTKRDIE